MSLEIVYPKARKSPGVPQCSQGIWHDLTRTDPRATFKDGHACDLREMPADTAKAAPSLEVAGKRVRRRAPRLVRA